MPVWWSAVAVIDIKMEKIDYVCIYPKSTYFHGNAYFINRFTIKFHNDSLLFVNFWLKGIFYLSTLSIEDVKNFCFLKFFYWPIYIFKVVLYIY
jgi:hypothetical protein